MGNYSGQAPLLTKQASHHSDRVPPLLVLGHTVHWARSWGPNGRTQVDAETVLNHGVNTPLSGAALESCHIKRSAGILEGAWREGEAGIRAVRGRGEPVVL